MRRDQSVLTADSHGFQIDGADRSFEIRWCDIREISTLKRDLLTTDLICLRFQTSDADEWVELHEEMTGFHDMVSVMEQQFTIRKVGSVT